MIMRYSVLIFTAMVMLLMSRNIRAIDWMDYDEPLSMMHTIYDENFDGYVSALTRAEEHGMYGPFITGYKYISGGAGEGQQYLSPNGEISNHPEVKTDEELPLFCDPPNPCPLGFEADECDASPMSSFTAEYSRVYQSEQNCQCDTDHDQCSTSYVYNAEKPAHSASNTMLKRSRRVRRNVHSKQRTENTTKDHLNRNSFHKGQTLRFHVAKKSPNSIVL